MNAIGIIPARWASTRFEGKVLADIAGKPMIQHVWENAKESLVLDDVIVATDSEKVIKAVEEFGGKAVYTSKDQPSGTDRIIEAVTSIDVNVVVNIQGDEPLIRHMIIDRLASAVLEDKKAQIATAVKKITDDKEIQDPNIVKVVVDKEGYALYFSRSPIPYVRDKEDKEKTQYFKHIGIYAYTKDFLFVYRGLPPSRLEAAEKLEQLKVLESGHKIKTVETELDTIGVDTPEDLERVKGALKCGK